MLRCPSCGSVTLMLGKIPDATVFAGRHLNQPLHGGELFRCRGCAMWFRWPQLSKATMDGLYASGRDDTWVDAPADRVDWMITANLLSVTEPGSVLDAGCFDGGFLAMIRPSWRRFGIEMNAAAAEKAKQRGATILGRDFMAIEGKFDAVVAFDVIEHVVDPAAFLRRLVDATSSGGFVVISTGNTQSSPWRWMKGNYWYCRFPEHISFINPSWCKRQARQLGLTLEIHRFSRGGSFAARLKAMAVNVLYEMLLVFEALGRKPRTGRLARLSKEGPPLMWPRDHMLVIFRRSRLT